MRGRCVGFALLAGGLVGAVAAADPDATRAAIAAVMDDWHAAAARADGARYFGHFAPGGIFMGTDDGERWSVEAFRAYAEPYFAKGQGWTYRAHARTIALAPDGRVAWLDEKLDNDAYGRLRGTAVLVRRRGRWKIAHYSMSFPIPNAVTKAAVAVIRGAESAPRGEGLSAPARSRAGRRGARPGPVPPPR